MNQAVTLDLQDTQRIFDYLSKSVADPSARREFEIYLGGAFHRFLIAIEYLPDEPGHVLEIGATPYFLTLLMKRFRPYSLELSNFFGDMIADSSQVHDITIDNPDYGEHHVLHYRQFNVERQPFPYPDATFEGVLFCEVLEHLTADPMAALAEMHRVLKSNGWLLITTPNASWYQNIANLWEGRNSVTLAYSPHGPYGRHNREYTFFELQEFVQAMGFDIERMDARDLQPGRQLNTISRTMKALRPSRYYEEGLFCVARKRRPLTLAHPAWLYALSDKMPVPAYLRKSTT